MKGIDANQSDHPTDRLTRLCNTMLEALRADPEYDDEKVILCLDTGKRGGIVHTGYDDNSQVVIDLIVHASAIAEADGKDIQLVLPDRN